MITHLILIYFSLTKVKYQVLNHSFIHRIGVSGTKMNLTTEFQATDAAVMKVTWNRFGVERIFDTKLRDED